MRFLVDQAVSWQVSSLLCTAGHDAVHVRDLGMAEAADEDILARALSDERTVITQDTDFGTLLATTRASLPSVVLLRMSSGLPSNQASAILASLNDAAEALADGAIVVIGETTIRIRKLPIGGTS